MTTERTARGHALAASPRLDRRHRRGHCCGMDYRDIITIEPGKRSAKPTIRGLRITVQDVLDYLASGMSAEEILSDFPELTAEDLRACLADAADRERRLFGTQAAE